MWWESWSFIRHLQNLLACIRKFAKLQRKNPRLGQVSRFQLEMDCPVRAISLKVAWSAMQLVQQASALISVGRLFHGSRKALPKPETGDNSRASRGRVFRSLAF